MSKVSYHDTVNDLPDHAFCMQGPFNRRSWFALLEQAGHEPLIAFGHDNRDTVCLPLERGPQGLQSLTTWYAFTWQPYASRHVSDGDYAALVAGLAQFAKRVELTKVPPDEVPDLRRFFRQADWLVFVDQCDVNHVLRVNNRSFAEYMAGRPGPLRTTLKRKAGKVQVALKRQFDAADWAAYEAIYAHSWKPEEGDPALLRRFAEGESAAGRYLFGMAMADGQPVAAQFWTVDTGTAYIHKLAHLESAKPLSPGTTLTAALFEEVIDRDQVWMIDFGTGNDRYKADWMEEVRPRYRVTCLRPEAPRNWAEIARLAARSLVSRGQAG